ncbi:hypothetical protein GM415_13345 [Pseudodesulfovibrio cashew]|uniref:4Fe4S-binding SPASM domain-containing protein n=1 Tax=Pseudodesulfovibrio cashew TaxID=2678688 RepID=A0A6I6JIU9_9BACT|nr:radical SAM/SPASM domain-containing protein [Pseudodesulfovibrio cashew]QGY41069.1 hypothetical protein GM415_13345 [Pseudodesulfovibrio cashew]
MENLKRKLIADDRYKEGLNGCLEVPQILLAPTNYCNLACSYCSTKNIRPSKVNMDLGLAKSIISQTLDNGWPLSFGQTYEPFLHPDIVEIIRFVMDRGGRFISATNGMAIGKGAYDLPMNLLLSFSADEDDYVYRNTAVAYDRYRAKLHAFLSHRIAHTVPGRISLQIADYSLFSGDMEYSKEIKDVDGILRKSLATAAWLGLDPDQDMAEWAGLIARRAPLPLFEDGETVIQVQPTKIMPNSYDAFVDMDVPAAARGYCDSCYTMMSIQADGKVAYCCCDPSANAIAGILDADTDLKEFWLGEEMNRVRRGFDDFAPIHSFCTQCLDNVSEHVKPLLTVRKLKVVAAILRDHGVREDLPWFKFPAGM